MVITTAQLHSTKFELRFCAGSIPARGVSEICDGEDLWQWSRLEIRLNAFRRSTIPQKQFLIFIIIIIIIIKHCRVLLVNTCFYFDSRWNLCFTLTITASFHWEIRQNLTIFCVTFSSERYLRRNFLLKLQAVLYQLQFYQRWTSLVGYFKKFLTKSVGKSFLDGYIYLLLSLKLFSRKKSVLL